MMGGLLLKCEELKKTSLKAKNAWNVWSGRLTSQTTFLCSGHVDGMRLADLSTLRSGVPISAEKTASAILSKG